MKKSVQKKKKSTSVKYKRNVKKKTMLKKKATKKKTAPREKAVKKKAAPKKSIKKKIASKKKAVKKKTASRKKVVKKKTASKKKVAKKKTASKKKAVKKKITSKRKVAKKKTVKKKIAPKVKKKTAATRSRPKPSKRARAKAYMTAKQLKYFYNILIVRKKALMEEAGRMVNHMKSDSNQYADSADRATQEEEFTLELRERDRERKLMRKIDEALMKISKKEYGYCVSCGIEIGISRLEARPTTDQCIDCKMIDELIERHNPA